MLSVLLQPMLLALALSLPLAAKWQLERDKVLAGAAVAGAGAALSGALLPAAGPILLAAVQGVVVVLLLAAMLLFSFHRDPERVPPVEAGAVLSPADGRVVYVKEVAGDAPPTSHKQGRPLRIEELAGSPLLREGGWLVGIAMNFLDVHVQRAPIRGRVALSREVKGQALSLRRPEALLANTRRTTLIEGEGLSAAVIQITSRLVRHIRAYIGRGDFVEAGQRLGMIRFGSQVDLLLPRLEGLKVVCQAGQRVKAGESVIARHGG